MRWLPRFVDALSPMPTRARAAMSEIPRSVRSYYESRLAEHGATAQGVDWRDDESHTVRNRVLMDLARPRSDETILDFGCGYGAFLGFLRSQGFTGRYVGVDLSRKMVEQARLLYGDDEYSTFSVADSPNQCVEVVVASGVFNVRAGHSLESWQVYVDNTIRLLARSATSRIALNFMSAHSDNHLRNPDLHYESIGRISDLLFQNVGRCIAVRQDYQLHEFSVVARRELEA
ncbi:MAG TPA: hypothetical protein DCS76_09475 [Gemmatimonadetes bacterium]|nr:hypothetical protein [Gemmatimonadota bacterium]